MEKQQELFEMDFSERILSEEEASNISKIERRFLESCTRTSKTFS